MAIDYNGKKPGRFWYFRQRCRILGRAFKDGGIKSTARAMRRNAVLSGGSIAAGIVLTMKYAALLPIIASWGPPAAGGVALFFGWRSWRNYRGVSKSIFMHNEIRKAEDKWLEKKQRPKLFKRIGAYISLKTSQLGRIASAPLRLFRRKPAADTQTRPQPSVNPTAKHALPQDQAATFDAVAKPAAAQDPQRAEAARKRAEERARRKGGNGTRFR